MIYEKNLGITSVHCGGNHNKNSRYRKGCIVYKIINDIVYSYISRKDVNEGINLDNNNYWQPISLTLEYI